MAAMKTERLAAVLFVCFIASALVGPVHTKADLELDAFAVTAPPVVDYIMGVDVPINATVDVQNTGVRDISGGEDDHFLLKLYFSNGDNFNDATRTSPEMGIAVKVDEDDLDKLNGSYPGSTATPPSPARAIGFAANVAMPVANCTEYSHLCAVLRITDDRIANDSSNGFHCLPLVAQPPLGAGYRDCRASAGLTTYSMVVTYTVCLISLLLQ